jgi:hypothetical protein
VVAVVVMVAVEQAVQVVTEHQQDYLFQLQQQ